VILFWRPRRFWGVPLCATVMTLQASLPAGLATRPGPTAERRRRQLSREGMRALHLRTGWHHPVAAGRSSRGRQHGIAGAFGDEPSDDGERRRQEHLKAHVGGRTPLLRAATKSRYEARASRA
jgi:hypothetical protein